MTRDIPAGLVVVMNPHGGGGRGPRLLAEVEPMFRRAGLQVEVRATTGPGHARELAREVPCGEDVALCALGGDGTVHEVVNGIMERPEGGRPALGVLPGGSGNALMHDLAALDAREAARRILRGATRPIDILRLEHATGVTYAFNIVGWGLVADVGRRAERLRVLGAGRYTVASLLELAVRTPRRARVELPDEVLEGRFHLVFAGNTRHTGTGMRLTPDARLDDGLVDLLLVRGGSRWALLRLFAALKEARHLSSPLVTVRRVPSFRIEADDDAPLNVDGELAAGVPCAVEVLPRAIRLLV